MTPRGLLRPHSLQINDQNLLTETSREETQRLVAPVQERVAYFLFDAACMLKGGGGSNTKIYFPSDAAGRFFPPCVRVCGELRLGETPGVDAENLKTFRA